MKVVGRLSRLAPEEIAAVVLLAVVLGVAALQPAAIGRLFESPYATPAPGGGPALEFLRPSPTPSPASIRGTTPILIRRAPPASD